MCDEELLDKEIETKKMKVKVSKYFYGGKVVDEGIALRIMKEATVGNLMGKKIVDLAIKNGFIIKENVITIGGMPHAQFVKI